MALRLRHRDRTVVLPTGQLFVGRSSQCQIVVDDLRASRRHALITMSKEGAFIADLGSRLGVIVNGAVISAPRRLARGDEIQVASARIQVDDATFDEEPPDAKTRATLAPPSPPPITVPAPTPRLRPTPVLGVPRVELGAPEPTMDTVDEPADALTRTQEAPRATLPDLSPRSGRDSGSAVAISSASGGTPRSSTPDPSQRSGRESGSFPAITSVPVPRPSTRESGSFAAVPAPRSSRESSAGLGPATQRSASESGSFPAIMDPRLRGPESVQRAAPPSLRGEAPDPARIGKLPPLPSFPSAATLRALAIMGEKAIAVGRAEEAERILQRALADVLEATRRREGEIEAPTAELAASLAAKLATVTGAGRWFDCAVELYAARGELAPAAVIDLLFGAVHKVKGVDKALFRDYVAAVRGAPSDSPARRFLVLRLEGLKGLVDLK
jgi:pSer/pThr/pTyr-binding forkhead associated (FHA) protein